MQRTVFTRSHHHKMRNLYTMSLKISQLISSSSSFLLYFSIFLSFFILLLVTGEMMGQQMVWGLRLGNYVGGLGSQSFMSTLFLASWREVDNRLQMRFGDIPSAMYKNSSCLPHLCQHLALSSPFNFSSTLVISHYGFNLCFSDQMTLSTFSYTYWSFECVLLLLLLSAYFSFSHFSIGLEVFFLWLVLLYMFWISPLSWRRVG